jgi:hypothetical protein
MSKILNASCDAAGVVKVEGITVPEAVVMSAGKQSSTGLVIIDKKNVKYLTLNTTDLETLIDKTSSALDDISAAINKIALTLTSIGAGMTGPTTAPPGTLVADVLEIAGKVAEINAVKIELDTLKGALK